MVSGSRVLEQLDAFYVDGIESQSASESPDKRWIQLVKRAAASHCTLLITGETGVGKEHLARWAHRNSPRRKGPFAPVNCGAIPETIIDSQLFGHVRGSFTGATSDHLGLIRAAESGTLFLDEVGELPPSAQIRLLRLLQDREIQPVGRSHPYTVDVRVVAATNGNLQKAVEESKFRADLLFRLDVVQLRVRPLRDRTSEIGQLTDDFNDEFATLYGQPRLEWDPGAIALLKACPWPGNIRQLRNVVERLHVLSPRQRVTVERLLELGQLSEAPPRAPHAGSLQRVKFEAVKRVLTDAGGSVAKAAEVFGVHRSTIYRWLKER